MVILEISCMFLDQWKTRDGKVIQVSQMTDEHLTNAILMLMGRSDTIENRDALKVLGEEADRRTKYGLME